MSSLAAETSHQQAVIYARVSGAKQVTGGDGLNSQISVCREYAEFKHYEVVEVFTDDLTGAAQKRPGMDAMLGYLRKHRHQDMVVIIDDITRLARDMAAHLKLRTDIAEAGGMLQSPSIEFSDDPDSVLVENMLASVSQHKRQKNAVQTKNRMRGRTLNGYWVFQAPVGYKFERVSGHGKLLVPDEPNASILREGLEGFASGRFATQSEFKRFLESQPCYPKDLPGGQIRMQRIKELLTRPLYAGYIEIPNWNVSLREGKHEGLISMKTFQKIQERLNETALAPARKDLAKDFPLRGFVLCGDCHKPLRGSWSKGNTKHYAYYLCQTKGCASYGKSIKRADIQGDFEDLLQGLRPARELFLTVQAMLKDMWEHSRSQWAEQAAAMKKRIKTIERKVEQLVDRIMDSESTAVITAYEKRVTRLEREKAMLSENAKQTPENRGKFEDVLELALCFLANPYKLWASGDLANRRLVLKMTFAKRLAYHRNQGYRTPEISIPFKLLQEITDSECEMVPGRGLEPPQGLPTGT